ncbi:hypothetical protein B0T14DRAFT_569018 [Immersiella caudata]|uniref:Transposase n=1 Tax=Immersiella caudata TaxID=314043 RepID=A0AA40BXS6_9PEZI|nr:hypothetical protein B0T14DRAFT_569018 [Immersiella caudata]
MGHWGHCVSDKLFSEFRAKERKTNVYSYKNRIIVLAAMMMHVGAQIKPEQMQHIRKKALPNITSREGFQWICDDDFRGPGHRQFLAALDNYPSGTPRNFDQPSCHGCAKNAEDIGRPLLRCSGCTLPHAWYCDEVCLTRGRVALGTRGR